MPKPPSHGHPSTDAKNPADAGRQAASIVHRLAGQPRIVLALLAVYLFWGSSYLAIKEAGSDFPPLLLVGLRNVLAGALFLTLALAQKRPLGSLRAWRHASMVGVLMISVAATLLAMGMRTVSPGMAAVTFACVPVVVCLLLALKGSSISRTQWLGTLVGVSGMWLISQGSGAGMPSTGLAFILAAVVATAVAAVLMDHLPMPQDLVVTTGVQMFSGGAVATVAGWWWGERIDGVSPQAWVAWLYLSLVVSGLGYMAYAYLVTQAGPVLASSYAYVNPPVALVMDAWVLGEHLSANTLLATGLVLAGALIALWATPSRPAQLARQVQGEAA